MRRRAPKAAKIRKKIMLVALAPTYSSFKTFGEEAVFTAQADVPQERDERENRPASFRMTAEMLGAIEQ